ncbi:hypothetical protein VOLCADRAFT_91007 [Volvox carteri f. nagariensis]|uniref:Uncharacterized protein n=1 Tax=Volvox carteri f. nagariensis TaxID=3068 RepID=D8TVY0_VOLCA|nr:uncharacterized protein VOLCADRAFT_91007 [Volvox carteri f. nagariensis]EFJ48271.1 hypothetical protein VOLCADRAFT_91007 [Volvox carteri f. nagariensis]|eukprot:XP_002950525.1 hypothetical protein VOLCADRAFT_91007 [Volvox carteri f. nagariensis]
MSPSRHVLSLREVRRSLKRQHDRCTAAEEDEAHRCAAFDTMVSERHRRELTEPIQLLETSLAKVEQRLSYARQTYDMAALTVQLDEHRARREALQVADIQAQLARRERVNVETVEASQAALREARSSLAQHQQRQADARQRLLDTRSQRAAAANRLADLQRAIDTARQTLSFLDHDPK